MKLAAAIPVTKNATLGANLNNANQTNKTANAMRNIKLVRKNHAPIVTIPTIASNVSLVLMPPNEKS